MIKFNKDKTKLHLAAEYELMRLCALAGFDFAVPPPKTPYDLLVDFGQGFKKIQVKSSYKLADSNNHQFSLRKKRYSIKSMSRVYHSTKYDITECDFFFLYDLKGNSWLIPFELVLNRTEITPGTKYKDYKIEI